MCGAEKTVINERTCKDPEDLPEDWCVFLTLNAPAENFPDQYFGFSVQSALNQQEPQ